jgi:membrane protein YdbS with pleckstrin-like domain
VTTDPPPAPLPVALREPAHLVSLRAVAYWRLASFLRALVGWAVVAVAVVLIDDRQWWVISLAVTLVVASTAYVLVMPTLRYRIHRWEVTSEAIHTRSGWLSLEQRVAPLSRVQTVDSEQRALMRPFGLATVTVTTASAAGPITIECLDQEVAKRLVADLTEYAARTAGDAT